MRAKKANKNGGSFLEKQFSIQQLFSPSAKATAATDHEIVKLPPPPPDTICPNGGAAEYADGQAGGYCTGHEAGTVTPPSPRQQVRVCKRAGVVSVLYGK